MTSPRSLRALALAHPDRFIVGSPRARGAVLAELGQSRAVLLRALAVQARHVTGFPAVVQRRNARALARCVAKIRACSPRGGDARISAVRLPDFLRLLRNLSLDARAPSAEATILGTIAFAGVSARLVDHASGREIVHALDVEVDGGVRGDRHGSALELLHPGEAEAPDGGEDVRGRDRG